MANSQPCALIVMGVSGSGKSTVAEALIASRLAARRGHFMPAGLLASQFRTLEPPGADEHPFRVSIDATVEAIVDDILRQVKLACA